MTWPMARSADGCSTRGAQQRTAASSAARSENCFGVPLRGTDLGWPCWKSSTSLGTDFLCTICAPAVVRVASRSSASSRRLSALMDAHPLHPGPVWPAPALREEEDLSAGKELLLFSLDRSPDMKRVVVVPR